MIASVLLTKMDVQPVDDFAHDDILAVAREQTKGEAAILLQVIANEHSTDLSVLDSPLISIAQLVVDIGFRLGIVHGQLSSHVRRPAVDANDTEQPRDEITHVEGGEQQNPKPENEKDFLVEEIDRQHALNGVAMDDAHFAYVKVAQCHAWKSLGFSPVKATNELGDHLEAEQMVLVAQKSVQQEDLDERIDQEE